jgi:hypothetical protein
MIRFALFLNAIGLRRAGEWLMTWKLRRNTKGTIFEHGTAHFVPVCPNCGGAGVVDSGGVTPWGTPIDLPCSCIEGAGER